MYITDHNKMEIIWVEQKEFFRSAPREENKWSGYSPGSPTVLSPPTSAASSSLPTVQSIAISAASPLKPGSYKSPKHKFEKGELTLAQLKSITQICNESPNATRQDHPAVNQWKIFHHTSDTCLTVPFKFTEHFGDVVWIKEKLHYGANTRADRIIYKVYINKGDRYGGFDVYDSWLEWIGERPKPLKDIEELFEI